MFSRIENRNARATRTLWIAALGLALALGAASASAQELRFRGFFEKHERVESEYKRTQQLWEDVNTRVGQSNLPGLRALVDQARSIQAKSWDALVTSRQYGDEAPRVSDRHLQNSLTLTLRARDLTTRAARQLREELSQEENARRTLERARQQFERLGEDGSRLRGQATQLLERAELQWRDGHFEQALRLAQNALAVIETADEHDRGEADSTRLSEALQRARERFENAKGAGAPRAQLRAIENLLEQAERALRADRNREATQRLLTARRALDDLESNAGPETSRTEVALRRLDAQIERIQDRLDGDRDATAQRLLSQATEARDRAQRALRDGDESRAQRQIRAAADLLARLQRQVGAGR